MLASQSILEKFHTGELEYKKQSEICRLLGISSRAERDAIGRILKTMEEEGDLVRDERGRFVTPQRLGLILCTVQGNERGFAFGVRDDGEDLFFPPRALHGALHGDTVYARIVGGEHGDEGAVYSIVRRGMPRLTGVYYRDRKGGFVEADERRFCEPVHIIGGTVRAFPGEKVVVRIISYPDGRAICPYTDKQLREVIRDAYERLVTDDYYFDYTAKAKPVISSGIMASFGIMGISFVPTAEAGYNKDMPMVEKAATIAHEFAHIHGVMREDEANALAAYVLLNSGDPYLKYSFYLDNMGFLFTFICYNVDPNYYTLNYPTHSAYRIENEYCRTWWNEHDFMTAVGNFFNDLYLKLQGQEDGTGSYVELPEIDGEETVDEEGNVVINYHIKYNTIQRIVLDYYN